MTYIFISPNYPAGHWRYVAALRAAGHTVLGIGDAGEETFPAVLRGNLNEYYRVGDLHDYESVYRACAWLISRHGRPDTIESLNDYWCDLVDALNIEFCGDAVSVDTCYSARIERIAQCAAEGMLPCGGICGCADTALSLAQEVGFPLLAVPSKNKRFGRKLLEDEGQIAALYDVYPDEPWLLLSQHSGEPVVLDGLCALDENDEESVVAVAAHVRTQDGLYSIPLTDSQRERVRALVGSTVGCGFFHIDAIRLERAVPRKLAKGEVLFNFIQDAPPSELMVDCLSAEFGCDLRAVWAQETELCGPVEQKSFGAIACRSFDRSYKNAHEKVLRRINIKLAAHGRPPYEGGEFKNYYYIFTGESPAELRRYIKFITEDFAK